MAKSKFALRNQKGGTPVALRRVGSKWLIDLEDEDGAVVYRGEFDNDAEAFRRLGKAADVLREFRLQQLGVASVRKLKEDYREAKDAADAARDRFMAAKAAMESPDYAAARAELRF